MRVLLPWAERLEKLSSGNCAGSETQACSPHWHRNMRMVRPFGGVQHLTDKTGHRPALRATASPGGFLHNGLVGIDKSHPSAPESTLRDSCLAIDLSELRLYPPSAGRGHSEPAGKVNDVP